MGFDIKGTVEQGLNKAQEVINEKAGKEVVTDEHVAKVEEVVTEKRLQADREVRQVRRQPPLDWRLTSLPRGVGRHFPGFALQAFTQRLSLNISLK